MKPTSGFTEIRKPSSVKKLRLNLGVVIDPINLVPKAFSLAWGRGGKGPFPVPPASQGKGPGNEVVIQFFKKEKM